VAGSEEAVTRLAGWEGTPSEAVAEAGGARPRQSEEALVRLAAEFGASSFSVSSSLRDGIVNGAAGTLEAEAKPLQPQPEAAYDEEDAPRVEPPAGAEEAAMEASVSAAEAQPVGLVAQLDVLEQGGLGGGVAPTDIMASLKALQEMATETKTRLARAEATVQPAETPTGPAGTEQTSPLGLGRIVAFYHHSSSS
jgi:hypothetical protein